MKIPQATNATAAMSRDDTTANAAVWTATSLSTEAIVL